MLKPKGNETLLRRASDCSKTTEIDLSHLPLFIQIQQIFACIITNFWKLWISLKFSAFCHNCIKVIKLAEFPRILKLLFLFNFAEFQYSFKKRFGNSLKNGRFEYFHQKSQNFGKKLWNLLFCWNLLIFRTFNNFCF